MTEDTPFWMTGKKVSEKKFCDWFTKKHALIFYGGNFFDENGIVDDTVLRKMITREIEDWVEKDLAMQVDKIVKAMRLLTVVTEIDKDINAVHLHNGDYIVETGAFVQRTEITPNRLTVNYNPYAPKPVKFLEYMKSLFDETDIPTVQEFLGYCLIPTSMCQYKPVLRMALPV